MNFSIAIVVMAIFASIWLPSFNATFSAVNNPLSSVASILQAR